MQEEFTIKKEIKGEKRRKRKIMEHNIIDLLKAKGMTTLWKIVECERMEKRTSLCLVLRENVRKK